MGIKFSVHTDGMDAVRTAIAKACTRAEHVLAEQMEKDTQPFVPSSGAAAGLINRTRVIETVLYIRDLMPDTSTAES